MSFVDFFICRSKREEKYQLPAEIAKQRGQVQFDAIRRGKKMLKSSRDKNYGRCRSGDGGGETAI